MQTVSFIETVLDTSVYNFILTWEKNTMLKAELIGSFIEKDEILLKY